MQPRQQQQLGLVAMEIVDETERQPDNHDINNENNVDHLSSSREDLPCVECLHLWVRDERGSLKKTDRGIAASLRRARTTSSQQRQRLLPLLRLN